MPAKPHVASWMSNGTMAYVRGFNTPKQIRIKSKFPGAWKINGIAVYIFDSGFAILICII